MVIVKLISSDSRYSRSKLFSFSPVDNYNFRGSFILRPSLKRRRRRKNNNEKLEQVCQPDKGNGQSIKIESKKVNFCDRL